MADVVFFITASSSGFGKSIALEALRRGHKVIATARDASKLTALKEAGAHVMSLNVTDSDEVLAQKLKEANDVYGKITHVVNPAGFILEGAVEETSQEEVFAIFNTNVFGMANIARAATPYLRAAAKAGSHAAIAHFGSSGSWGGAPGAAFYAATKWAVSGLSEGLTLELKPFGVDAIVIEPGYFRTEFLNRDTGVERRMLVKKVIKEYEGTPVDDVRKALNQVNNNQLGDVEKGAVVIVDVLTKSGVASGRDVPVRLVLGTDCLEYVRNKIADTAKLLGEWEEITKSTDHRA